MIRKTLIPNLLELKLANATPLMQSYFHDLMVDLEENCLMGGLLIVNDEDELGFGVNGVFRTAEAADCILIPANQAQYNEDSHTLYLTDLGISTLVHEGNHFRHKVIDKGRWMSGTCQKKHSAPADRITWSTASQDFIFDLEYECGWRTVQDAMVYFDERPELMLTIIGAQVVNLSAYRSEPIDIIKTISKLTDTVNANKDKKNMHLMRKLTDQIMYRACGEYMKDRQFVELADIEHFNFDATNHDKVLIELLYQAIR